MTVFAKHFMNMINIERNFYATPEREWMVIKLTECVQ